MKDTRRRTIYLFIALAGFLMTTPVALLCFRDSGVVCPAPTENIVISDSSGVVTSCQPVSSQPLCSKEVEAAERINAEMMRRSRENWERTFPFREPGK